MNRNYYYYKNYQYTEKGRRARRKAVKNYKKKNPEYFKNINKKYIKKHRSTNISIRSNYETWNEFLNELTLPVPIITDEMIEFFKKHKAFRLFKQSPEKVAITALMVYLAPRHRFYYEMYFFGSLMKFKDTIQSSKYNRFIELFLDPVKNTHSFDDHIGQGYTYRFIDMQFEFLPIKESIEYYQLIGKKEFENALEFLKNNRCNKDNVNYIRFYKLLRMGIFRVKHLFEINDRVIEETYLDKINSFYVKKIHLKKFAKKISKKEIKKLIKNVFKSKDLEEDINVIVNKYFAKQDEYTLEDVLKILKNSFYQRMNRIVDLIKRTLDNVDISELGMYEKIDLMQYGIQNADILFFLNKRLKKLDSRVRDINRVLSNIDEKGNLIVEGVDRNDGRIYSLFTNINRDLRKLILEYLGFQYEVDIKSSVFQLLKDEEKKILNTSLLEFVYNNMDPIIDQMTEEYTKNKGLKRKQRAKIKKVVKQDLITALFGGKNGETGTKNYRFLKYLNKETLGQFNQLLKSVYNVGKELSHHYMKYEKYKFSHIKKLNEKNILYYKYISLEDKAIKEISQHFGEIIRVHDAIYVKQTRKQVKYALSKIPYYCGITKINKYSQFLKDILVKDIKREEIKNYAQIYKENLKKIFKYKEKIDFIELCNELEESIKSQGFEIWVQNNF